MYHETKAFSEQNPSLVTRQQIARGGIELLASRITHARRHRFSSGVEAMVSVTFRYHPVLPSRTETLHVSLPRRAGSRPGALRERMTGMALDLAVLMHRSDRGGSLRPI